MVFTFAWCHVWIAWINGKLIFEYRVKHNFLDETEKINQEVTSNNGSFNIFSACHRISRPEFIQNFSPRTEFPNTLYHSKTNLEFERILKTYLRITKQPYLSYNETNEKQTPSIYSINKHSNALIFNTPPTRLEIGNSRTSKKGPHWHSQLFNTQTRMIRRKTTAERRGLSRPTSNLSRTAIRTSDLAGQFY